MVWARRLFGPAVALLSGVVLSTSFGFLHIHSGRSANPDPLFALVVLLTVVALWAAGKQPWHRAWLGPLLAAAFLLKGMAVLMPLSIVAGVEMGRWRSRSAPVSLAATLVSIVLFVVPVGAWALARWQFDEWQFLQRVVIDDFLGHAFFALEGHARTPLYYVDVLQQHHYDWLVAGAAAWLLFPVPWSRIRGLSRFGQSANGTRLLLGCWAAATFLIPTLMQSRLPWYLNAFYPAFALGVGVVLARGFREITVARRARAIILVTVTVVAVAVAEGKLLWYSVEHRDVTSSIQGLLLAEKAQLAGHRVFRDDWQDADSFVASALVGVERRTALDTAGFLRDSAPGDYLIRAGHSSDPRLVLVRSNGRDALFVRPD